MTAGAVRAWVFNAVQGAEAAAGERMVCAIVDALRASATVTSLLAAGAERVLVVAEPDDGVAVAGELRRRGERALLVGERGGVKLPDYDRGNEPALGEHLDGTVVFTSSNCAACCLAAAGAPALILATTVNASAAGQAAADLATARNGQVALVMAGFFGQPWRINLEDLLACGAVIDRGGMVAANDAAKAAVYAFRYVTAAGLERQFIDSEHGRHLVGLGRQVDIRYCAQVDAVGVVPVAERAFTVAGVRVVELRGREWPAPALRRG